ncbi:glycoside hydrolase family 78 protein [Pseudozobellia thermophila]|uniref:alpha-L-rhamnosidase n=1 Tax=Pseudozobellia thermophila TaxID=192903 RepID=A0A1M6HL46_9FLAO|nr:glycoside hydrolase family 78 protein [Pseudozobellia thermophila]SHJ22896.1 alpha-L-rhamnosidase [Pseudozobellia thermophila]
MKAKKIIVLLVVLSTGLSSFVSKETGVRNLVTEYKTNPIGIDIQKPRLSWQLQSDEKNVLQTAYEIRVAGSKEEVLLGKNLIWSTGKIESDQSVNVVYEGPELKSMSRVYWQVRIWDHKRRVSRWSEPAFWEMGILDKALWTANYIAMNDITSEKKSHPSQYFRTEFKTKKAIRSARVQATSLGLYELYLNGQKVGDELFTPGFTSYHNRLQYQTYDVTEMLKDNNAIGAIVGDGWYRGNIGWMGDYAHYGKQLALLVQLQITYIDGTSETVITNKDWKASYGPILESDMYNGEKYDARLEMTGWSKHGFDDSAWQQVEILNHSKDILVAPQGPPVKAIEEIKPKELIITPKGETVLDLGQNIVGWARMKIQGPKGHKVTLKFAEVLDKDGNFYTKNLRAAKATDSYILKGKGEEVFEPHFTFHGFRYIQVIDFPGDLKLENITGIVVHSDIAPTGSFSTSDPMINQLQSNIQWGQRGNFLDIPTDCPQRDERAGWTGDAQVFSMTAAFNFEVATFYTKWLKDLALDQHDNGLVPNVIPDILSRAKGVAAKGGATGWADAAVIIPWTVYQSYGDKRILEEQYSSMKGWVDYMAWQSGEDYLWNNSKHWHWGDWLAYDANSPAYNGSVTEKDLIATAYAYYSTTLFSKIASVLGKYDDANKYADLAKNIKEAFVQEYITPNGRLVSHTQTAYAMALSFDLIPEHLIEKSASYLAQDVKRFGHLTTGFLGTPLLCKTLSKIGRDDLAFMLLNRKEFPSWLYPITMGATTIWERWDTQKPDGTIIEGMNSFNHYSYGAIGEWLYTHVGGLRTDPENPGYKHIIFDPHPGGGLTLANTEFNSLYGKIQSNWKIKDSLFEYEIRIPPNTTATVTLPGAKTENLMIDNQMGKMIKQKNVTKNVDGLQLKLGSGNYTFTYPVSDLNSVLNH